MADIERDAPIEEDTLVALIRQAQQQSAPSAFEGLYLLYADRIYRFLLTRLGDMELTEEVTAQVFLHLIENIHKYRVAPKDNVAIFSAWLYRMAYNKMVDILRKRRRSTTLPLDYAAHVMASDRVADTVMERLHLEHVLHLMNMLNEQQRQVVLLRFIEELSITETAKIMDKSEGAIKALQHRALDNLRRILELRQSDEN